MFYQLRGDKWTALPSPVDDAPDRSQLIQLAEDDLAANANPLHCAPNSDILRLRNWTAADTAVLYAPCFARTSGQIEAGFLFTLKFDEAGNWKIVDTRRMSKNELDNE